MFGEPIDWATLRDKTSRGVTPECLFVEKVKRPQGPEVLFRQELWAVLQLQPISRSGGEWAYIDTWPPALRNPQPLSVMSFTMRREDRVLKPRSQVPLREADSVPAPSSQPSKGQPLPQNPAYPLQSQAHRPRSSAEWERERASANPKGSPGSGS